MISRERFVEILRGLGFRFKRRSKTDKNEIYRKKGSTHCVNVPRKDWIDDIYVRAALRQCGLIDKDIDLLMQPPAVSTEKGAKDQPSSKKGK